MTTILRQLDSYQPYSSDGVTRLLELDDGTFLIGFDLPKEGEIPEDLNTGYGIYSFQNLNQALDHWRVDLVHHFHSGYNTLTDEENLSAAYGRCRMLKKRYA